MLHSTNSMLILYLPSEAWSSGKEISSSQRGESRFKFQPKGVHFNHVLNRIASSKGKKKGSHPLKRSIITLLAMPCMSHTDMCSPI